MTGNHDELVRCLGACADCAMRGDIVVIHTFLHIPKIRVKCRAVAGGHTPVHPIFGVSPDKCRRLLHYVHKQVSDDRFYKTDTEER